MDREPETHEFVVEKNGAGVWSLDREFVHAKPGDLVVVTAIGASELEVEFDPELDRRVGVRNKSGNLADSIRIRPHHEQPQIQLTYKFTIWVDGDDGVIDPEIIIKPPW